MYNEMSFFDTLLLHYTQNKHAIRQKPPRKQEQKYLTSYLWPKASVYEAGASKSSPHDWATDLYFPQRAHTRSQVLS